MYNKNIFKTIISAFLQLICFKYTHANGILNDVDGNSENYLDDKYFIIVNKADNHNDYDKVDDSNLNPQSEYYLLLDKNLKPVQRRFRDIKKEREERKQAQLLKIQQERKVKEITDFMKDHQMTTNFLYNELQRIKRQRIVKDELRIMVEYLEKPGKHDMRSKILKCYQEARRAEALSNKIQGLETNNMVINVLKDPYNYGYINK